MKVTTNFKHTLAQLTSFLSLPIQNDRDKSGIIQAFEFTFEQSWKSIQKLAGAEGVLTIASPKSAFGFALAQGWILPHNEALFLQMIKDRNLSSHTYQRALADEILLHIQNQYVTAFTDLLKALEAVELEE